MIYLDQNLRNFYKYLTWIESIESNFVLNFPTRSVYKEMKSRRLGLTCSYGEVMSATWKKRYDNNKNAYRKIGVKG